jgi:hypothetical protein
VTVANPLCTPRSGDVSLDGYGRCVAWQGGEPAVPGAGPRGAP